VGVLLPLGSLEQHGPHLPLGADTLVAQAVAERAVAALNDVAEDQRTWSLGPEIGLGASGEHQDFPGTLSIGTEALSAVLVELGRSASSQGWRLVVVSGHGGNRDALVHAGSIWREESIDAAWVPCVPAPTGPETDGPETDGPETDYSPVHDAHAGHTETSLLLHLHPDLVDMTSATPGETTPLGQLLPALQKQGVKAVSPTGVLGDPTTATAALGEKYLEEMVAGVLRRIQHRYPDNTSCLVDPVTSRSAATSASTP
jgi:mycofactocin precursor peptide peptidase